MVRGGGPCAGKLDNFLAHAVRPYLNRMRLRPPGLLRVIWRRVGHSGAGPGRSSNSHHSKSPPRGFLVAASAQTPHAATPPAFTGVGTERRPSRLTSPTSA